MQDHNTCTKRLPCWVYLTDEDTHYAAGHVGLVLETYIYFRQRSENHQHVGIRQDHGSGCDPTGKVCRVRDNGSVGEDRMVESFTTLL